jgi:hypothetical protein
VRVPVKLADVVRLARPAGAPDVGTVVLSSDELPEPGQNGGRPHNLAALFALGGSQCLALGRQPSPLLVRQRDTTFPGCGPERLFQDTSARTFLDQVLARRVDDSILSPEQRHALVAWSGGVLRNLIALARNALEEAFLETTWHDLDLSRSSLGHRGPTLLLVTERSLEPLHRSAPHFASWLAGAFWRLSPRETVETLVFEGRVGAARALIRVTHGTPRAEVLPRCRRWFAKLVWFRLRGRSTDSCVGEFIRKYAGACRTEVRLHRS